jgi:hypothetical protein
MLSFHFVCFRFTLFASVSLCRAFGSLIYAFVSLCLLSFHFVRFCSTLFAFVSLNCPFVSLSLLSFHFVCFRFTLLAQFWEQVRAVQLHLRSTGKYGAGQGAFLLPLYGAGALAEVISPHTPS